MSWKGFTKAMSRLPHQLAAVAGYSETTVDEDLNRLVTQFEEFNELSKKLYNDAQKFKDSFSIMLDHQVSFSENLTTLFLPIRGLEEETSALDGAQTSREFCMARDFAQAMAEVRETLKVELDVIEQRVIQPVSQLIQLQDNVKRHIVKRNHKLLDYDRHRNAVKSVQQKTDRDYKTEQKLGKMEADFAVAANEYNHINNTLKQEIPIMLSLKSPFMDPLFQTLYWYQLRVYSMCYHAFDKVVRQYFDPNVSAEQFYVNAQTKLVKMLDSLSVIKRPMKVAGENGAASPQGTAPPTGYAQPATMGYPQPPQSHSPAAAYGQPTSIAYAQPSQGPSPTSGYGQPAAMAYPQPPSQASMTSQSPTTGWHNPSPTYGQPPYASTQADPSGSEAVPPSYQNHDAFGKLNVPSSTNVWGSTSSVQGQSFSAMHGHSSPYNGAERGSLM